MPYVRESKWITAKCWITTRILRDVGALDTVLAEVLKLEEPTLLVRSLGYLTQISAPWRCSIAAMNSASALAASSVFGPLGLLHAQAPTQANISESGANC
jgi:hypothetical protein